MTAVLLAAWLAGGTVARASDPAAADELYRAGTAAFAAGDLATADGKLAAFRDGYRDSPRFWAVSLLWARCATGPDDAKRRFDLVARDAPPATKAECELELCHLGMLGERWGEAGDAYAAWLANHPEDPRADEAAFYRAVCLKGAGRLDDAEAALAALKGNARRDLWRAQAGLLLGAVRQERGEKAGAAKVYRELAGADWARDVRPQALLGAARAASDPAACRARLKELIAKYPGTPEAAQAADDLKVARPSAVRYGVQVGAYQARRNADADRKAWKARGRAASVARRKGMGLDLYCVVIGPYATREQADADHAALAAQGTPSLVITY